MDNIADIKTISTIIGLFGGVGVLMIGFSYAYSSWKNGGNKYKEELIGDLKATLEVREQTITDLNEEKTILINSHQQQLTKLQTELTELRVRFDEQSKKLKEYASILENRDPKTLEILTNIKRGIDKLTKQGNIIHSERKIVADTLAKKKKVTVSI